MKMKNLHVSIDKSRRENSLLKEETKELNKRIEDFVLIIEELVQ